MLPAARGASTRVFRLEKEAAREEAEVAREEAEVEAEEEKEAEEVEEAAREQDADAARHPPSETWSEAGSAGALPWDNLPSGPCRAGASVRWLSSPSVLWLSPPLSSSGLTMWAAI